MSPSVSPRRPRVTPPPGNELEPVPRESTPSIIAGQLRAAIMYGTLAPGVQLGEADLAARLGVSRGPLREAMQRLVQEGLLRSERHRGLFVIDLKPADIHDIYAARRAVECAAATLIARDRPAPAARRLREVHDTMLAAAARNDSRALSDADMYFHEILVAQSGSTRLMRMAGTLLVETRMCITALERTYQLPTEVSDEHEAIIDALEAGNEERAIKVIDAHMDDGVRRLARRRAGGAPVT
ncbi:MAG: GntR family transcriptional regulator [Carbonactinosporaceae bacterium]